MSSAPCFLGPSLVAVLTVDPSRLASRSLIFGLRFLGVSPRFGLKARCVSPSPSVARVIIPYPLDNSCFLAGRPGSPNGRSWSPPLRSPRGFYYASPTFTKSCHRSHFIFYNPIRRLRKMFALSSWPLCLFSTWRLFWLS